MTPEDQDPASAVTTIAVTDLVRFCFRRGDIDHRFTPSPTGPQGIAGHQHLYQSRPASYQPEYPVEWLYRAKENGTAPLRLRGRVDGYDAEQTLVEEIKTCRVSPDTLPANVTEMHWAQGKLYAAMLARQENIEQLTVRITWLNIDKDETQSESSAFSRESLETFLDETLEQFAHWLSRVDNLRRARDRGLEALRLPYGDFRQGQRDIAELTYKCIDQKGHLLVEAPTGIGKTAAVLFPALKALGQHKVDRLIFSTAKSSGRRTAQDTLANLNEAGAAITSLSMTAKEKICLSPGKACHPEDCPYAQGYYDKLHDAMAAALPEPTTTQANPSAKTAGRLLHREHIEALAREHQVCPYELSLDLLPWVDVVIADLHYSYSLHASIHNLYLARGLNWAVLVDEAHNLPQRARGMYSGSLRKAAILAAKKNAKGDVRRALQSINRQLLALQKVSWDEPDFHSSESLPETLIHSLERLVQSVSAELAATANFLQQRPVLKDCFFEVLQFLRVCQCWGEDYRFEMQRTEGQQSLTLRLNCLDASRMLTQRQAEAQAVIAFSATLAPMVWSRIGLGLKAETVCFQAPSPFVADQMTMSCATHIDTRYQHRETSLAALCQLLQQWLEQKSGNCIVYFPSYAYLALVAAALTLPTDRHLWLQRRNTDEADQSELLQRLHQRQDLVAFCLLGGVFGEGIDLPGDQLSSAVIVGVGMPQVNRDTKALQAWHQARNAQGFEYTFLYPGMQKVNQAIGRVIRRREDRGSALLIDPRYARQEYRNLLPQHWVFHDLTNDTPE